MRGKFAVPLPHAQGRAFQVDTSGWVASARGVSLLVAQHARHVSGRGAFSEGGDQCARSAHVPRPANAPA